MYWYMYRTCIGRDPTVQYLKKGIRDTIFGVSYPTFVPRSAAGVMRGGGPGLRERCDAMDPYDMVVMEPYDMVVVVMRT